MQKKKYIFLPRFKDDRLIYFRFFKLYFPTFITVHRCCPQLVKNRLLHLWCSYTFTNHPSVTITPRLLIDSKIYLCPVFFFFFSFFNRISGICFSLVWWVLLSLVIELTDSDSSSSRDIFFFFIEDMFLARLKWLHFCNSCNEPNHIRCYC